MNLFYFGTDKPWYDLLKIGFYRRNTWLLKSLIESKKFENIYIIHFTPVSALLSKIKSRSHYDIFFSNFFPQKILKYQFFYKINQIIIKILFVFQGVKNINSQKNIIWCYWPKGFIYAKNINLKGRYFFDTDHNIIDDENLDILQKNIQKDILLKAGQKCKKIITASRSMIAWYNNQGFDNVIRIRNGICLNRFSKIGHEKKNNNKVIIGYIGTLSRWINYDLFEKLIRRNPNWNFFIYGQNYKNNHAALLKKYSNVYFKGKVSAQEVPDIISQFDIALSLYKNEVWTDVDSMKIFEYFAAGVSVVSTSFHDYLDVDFENLLFIGSNVEELENHINYIIGKKIKPNYKSFLEKNTWKKRVEEIIALINE